MIFTLYMSLQMYTVQCTVSIITIYDICAAVINPHIQIPEMYNIHKCTEQM